MIGNQKIHEPDKRGVIFVVLQSTKTGCSIIAFQIIDTVKMSVSMRFKQSMLKNALDSVHK